MTPVRAAYERLRQAIADKRSSRDVLELLRALDRAIAAAEHPPPTEGEA